MLIRIAVAGAGDKIYFLTEAMTIVRHDDGEPLR
jgi:hypothetical protein